MPASMDELKSLILRHSGRPRPEALLPRLRLLASTGATLPTRTVYEPAFCIVAQGRKRAMIGDRVVEYAAGGYLIVSVDLPVCGEVVAASASEPYLAMTLPIDRASVAAVLLDLPSGRRPAGGTAGMDVFTVDEDLLDPVVRLLRLIDRPEDAPLLAPLAEREILYRLLTGPAGAMLADIAITDSHMSRIGRALDRIRREFDRTLRIEDLAAVSGMSVASFHRHFKAVTAMSPLQYQKHIRLQEARRLLLGNPMDAAGAGFSVGYESQSQFSREYARLFGAPPVRDAQRLRALAASEPARLAPLA